MPESSSPPANAPKVQKPIRAKGPSRKLLNLSAKLKEQAEKEGGFYFAPTQASIEGLSKGKVGSISLSDAIETAVLLKLASGDPEARSGGRTQGFSIPVPETFEREASAKRVRVQVLARSAAEESTRVGIAYSTNDVGNSGWRWRDVGPKWGLCKMVWKVPQMKEGKGDFIGLLPDRAGTPGVEIHSVSATIVV